MSDSKFIPVECKIDLLDDTELAFKRYKNYGFDTTTKTIIGDNGIVYTKETFKTVFYREFKDCFKFPLGDTKISDNVNHPAHYIQGGIECIDAMEAAYGTEAVIYFCMCNAFKYQWRFNKKNGREDILKCQWYQNKMVELQNKLNQKK